MREIERLHGSDSMNSYETTSSEYKSRPVSVYEIELDS